MKRCILFASLSVSVLNGAPLDSPTARQENCQFQGFWRILSISSTTESGEKRRDSTGRREGYLLVRAKSMEVFLENTLEPHEVYNYTLVRLPRERDGWIDIQKNGANDPIRCLFGRVDNKWVLAINQVDQRSRPGSFHDKNLRLIELIPERPDRLIYNHIRLPDPSAKARSKKNVSTK